MNEPVTVKSFGEYESVFGGLWLQSTVSFAVRDYFMNGGAEAIVVRLARNAGAALYEIPAAAGDGMLYVEAANPGSWGNRLNISIDHNTGDPGDTALFNLMVKERGGTSEIFRNVSVDVNSPVYLPAVLEKNSRLVLVRKTASGYDCPGTRPEKTLKAMLKEGNRGTNGRGLTIQEYIFAPGLEMNREGLWALEKADIFNLLCIPPYSRTRDTGSRLVSEAAIYCEKRRAILVADPPSDWNDEATAHNQFTATSNSYPGTASRNAALYFPRLVQPNPLRNGTNEAFAPCGAIAGIIARTDKTRGIWKAPAGSEARLAGVAGLSVALGNAENESLSRLGINCIRSFPVRGHLVWGARTLAGADTIGSEWKYLPVRRTALYIEESLYRGLQWVVFEPNGEPLWAMIRESVTTFLDILFRQGAFQGHSAKQAYFVKCDSQTTTWNDIDQGRVNFLVGFAPLKPAEFLVLTFRFNAGGQL